MPPRASAVAVAVLLFGATLAAGSGAQTSEPVRDTAAEPSFTFTAPAGARHINLVDGPDGTLEINDGGDGAFPTLAIANKRSVRVDAHSTTAAAVVVAATRMAGGEELRVNGSSGIDALEVRATYAPTAVDGGEGDDTLFLAGDGPAGPPTLDGGPGDDRFFVAFGGLSTAARIADSAGSADAVSVVCPLRRTVRPVVGPTTMTRGAERIDYAGVDSRPRRCSPDGFEGAVAYAGDPPPATTRLVGALARQRLSVRAGRPVHVDFISTNPGSAVLVVRRGSTQVIRVPGVVRRGRNRITWRSRPRHRGTYVLDLRLRTPAPELQGATLFGRAALRRP